MRSERTEDDLNSMLSSLQDIERLILRASFKGGFSVDQNIDIERRCEMITRLAKENVRR